MIATGQKLELSVRREQYLDLVLLVTNKVRVSILGCLPLPGLAAFHDVLRCPQAVTAVKLSAIVLLIVGRLIRYKLRRFLRLMRFVDGGILRIHLFFGRSIPVHMLGWFWGRRRRRWRSIVVV